NKRNATQPALTTLAKPESTRTRGLTESLPDRPVEPFLALLKHQAKINPFSQLSGPSKESSCATMSFTWGPISGKVLTSYVVTAYEELVFWLKNLFQIPNNSCGRSFISETTRILNTYVHGNPLEPIAMNK